MKLEERINVLSKLGNRLDAVDAGVIHQAISENGWFTKDSIMQALESIRDNMLTPHRLEAWLEQYKSLQDGFRKRVGLVLAGNIPLVGFHDILCCFITGNISVYKASSKDRVLIVHLLELMADIDPRTKGYFDQVDKLKDLDAVIATGSDNSSRYFEYYFSKYPHIIRKNRNSVAVLDGSESEDDLENLASDVFTYYGLGCRNVSKLLVPDAYSFDVLLEVFHGHNEIIQHNKYMNNFDYNIAYFLLNKENYLNNGSIILKEDSSLASRIASLHYEYYSDTDRLIKQLENQREQLQCIVSKNKLKNLSTIPFGKTQSPGLSDYADNVDTIDFLQSLSV